IDPVAGKIVARISELFLSNFQLPVDDLVGGDLMFAIDAKLHLEIVSRALFLLEEGREKVVRAVHLIQKVSGGLWSRAELLTPIQGLARRFLFVAEHLEKFNHGPGIKRRPVNV